MCVTPGLWGQADPRSLLVSWLTCVRFTEGLWSKIKMARVSELTQPVKVLSSPESDSWTPSGGRRDSCKLSSSLHKHTMACTPSTLTKYVNKNIIMIVIMSRGIEEDTQCCPLSFTCMFTHLNMCLHTCAHTHICTYITYIHTHITKLPQVHH